MVVIVVTPKPRQVLVVAEQGRLVGWALACRVRTPEDRIDFLARGTADGVTLSEQAFRSSMEETDLYFKAQFPEAEIVHLQCADGIHPRVFAEVEAAKRVRDDGC